MKTKILVLLAILSQTTIANDIYLSKSVSTNGGKITTTENFICGNQTNLVRSTVMKNGSRLLVRQRVYHDNILALDLTEMAHGITWICQTGLPFRVGTHLNSHGELDTVNIMSPSLVTLDHFTATNGVLYPVSTHDLDRANEITDIIRGH